jgi:hypothetical protein
MKRFALLVCVVSLSVLMISAGCKKSSPVAGTWVIEEYTLAGTPDEAKIGKEVTFTDDGKVKGFMGEGTYTVADDVVTVKAGAFNVEMKLTDGKLVVENPATKIVYKKK